MNQYLIIEKSKRGIYAYFEDATMFKNNEKQRKNPIKAKRLDEECCLDSYPNKCYFLIKLNRKKNNG